MKDVREVMNRAKRSKVSLPKDEFIREHEDLLKTLKSGKKKRLDREYREQSSELRKVRHEGR